MMMMIDPNHPRMARITSAMSSQMWVPQKHVNVLFLPVGLTVQEIVFFTFVLLLIVQECFQFWEHYESAEAYLKESIVRQRFRLRLKMLQHAAFQSLFPYRPEVLMAQLSRRIDATPTSKRCHGTKEMMQPWLAHLHAVSLVLLHRLFDCTNRVVATPRRRSGATSRGTATLKRLPALFSLPTCRLFSQDGQEGTAALKRLSILCTPL